MSYLQTITGLEALSGSFAKSRIAVVGDLMLDRYHFGSVTRMSPEAPVPILDIDSTETRLGGAANVGHNILTLGASPILFGVVGDDSKGDLMRTLLSDIGLGVNGIVSDGSRPTTIKTRVVAGSQQMLRIDNERKDELSEKVEAELFWRIETVLPECDGIILEDYNKGVLSASIIEKIITAAHKHDVKTFVDPKFNNFFAYKNVTVFKPNRKEMQDALGSKVKTDAEINAAGIKLLERLNAENVLLTLSEKGMRLFEKGTSEPFAIPTMAREVSDVSGAGDTVIATLAVATAAGASIREAAVIANRAAGIVVEDLGIVPIYRNQLFAALQEDVEESKL